MEEGGFTLIQEGTENMNSKSKKHKMSDGLATTMLGISEEEAKKAYRMSILKGQQIIGLDQEEYEAERERVLEEIKKEQKEDMLQQLELKKEGLPSMYNEAPVDKKKIK